MRLAHSLQVPHVLVESFDRPFELFLLLARWLVVTVSAFYKIEETSVMKSETQGLRCV